MLNAQSAEFADYFETLKILSHNSAAGEYLTESQLLAVDFDKYTKRKYYRQPPRPSSNDALYFTANYNYFIEFKGGCNTRKRKNKLHKKNRDSVNTLVAKAGENVNDIKSSYIYVLVYKPKLEPEQNFITLIGKLAGKKRVPFGLDTFKGTTFHDVHALSVEEFNNSFIAKHLAPAP